MKKKKEEKNGEYMLWSFTLVFTIGLIIMWFATLCKAHFLFLSIHGHKKCWNSQDTVSTAGKILQWNGDSETCTVKAEDFNFHVLSTCCATDTAPHYCPI